MNTTPIRQCRRTWIGQPGAAQVQHNPHTAVTIESGLAAARRPAAETRPLPDSIPAIDCQGAPLEVVSGPHPAPPTVLRCDVCDHRFVKGELCWLVTTPGRGWATDHGASCSKHLPAPDAKADQTTERRSTYTDAIAAAAERAKANTDG